MNGIDKMTALILSEAEAERDAKLEKATAEAEALLDGYRKEAEELTAIEAEKTAGEVNALIERAKASAAQTERNRLLERKSELLDAAYASALDQLCSDEAAAKDEYLTMLKAIFDAVLAEELAAEQNAIDNDLYGEYEAPECYTIRLNQRDGGAIGAALLKYAQKATAKANKTIVLDEQSAPIKGGFILVCGDIELNCSLELYMNKVRTATEGEVCGILFA